mmetsp:Transcript_26870/g.64478  ORF Transcript_26870/g.64478 Transcript_26870/m.64478 type:complete len:90 (-) Transcript_26870:645-914(-)
MDRLRCCRPLSTGGRDEREKKSLGRVPTSMDVRGTATQKGERRWTSPSAVSSATNGPEDRSPPRLLPPLFLVGGSGAAANMGLGNVAIP